MGLINDDDVFVDEVFQFAHCMLDFRILDFMFAHLNLQSLWSRLQQPTRPSKCVIWLVCGADSTAGLMQDAITLGHEKGSSGPWSSHCGSSFYGHFSLVSLSESGNCLKSASLTTRSPAV